MERLREENQTFEEEDEGRQVIEYTMYNKVYIADCRLIQ
jgi:hypothetical protein